MGPVRVVWDRTDRTGVGPGTTTVKILYQYCPVPSPAQCSGRTSRLTNTATNREYGPHRLRGCPRSRDTDQIRISYRQGLTLVGRPTVVPTQRFASPRYCTRLNPVASSSLLAQSPHTRSDDRDRLLSWWALINSGPIFGSWPSRPVSGDHNNSAHCGVEHNFSKYSWTSNLWGRTGRQIRSETGCIVSQSSRMDAVPPGRDFQ